MRSHSLLPLLALSHGTLALPQSQGTGMSGLAGLLGSMGGGSGGSGLGALSGLLGGGRSGSGGGALSALSGLFGGGSGSGGGALSALSGLLGGSGGGNGGSMLSALSGLFSGGGSGGPSAFATGPGSGGFNLLGQIMGPGSQASGLMRQLILSLGMDPNEGITSMVCKTFKEGETMGQMIGAVFGSPYGDRPGEECMIDTSGGSGPFKANYTTDESLPNHTIYVPKQDPGRPMPVIIWGNGFCMAAGTMFANFLNDIASYGIMIVANGPVEGGVTGFTTYEDLIKAIDWVEKNPAAKQWGEIDISKLVMAGQSCGGEEAYAASKDPRVKLTTLFNSPVFGGTAPIMKNPIAYFLGGSSDIAQRVGDQDWRRLPANLPAMKASIPIGHIGSYYQKYGGRMGDGARAFFKWQLLGDMAEKEKFCGPSAARKPLSDDGFAFEFKGGFCD